MRRLVLSMSILLGAACTPGSGEYGPCTTTADCQVNLQCEPIHGFAADDAGNEVADGGVCRVTCNTGTGSTNCPGGEICGSLGGRGFCSSDGGY